MRNRSICVLVSGGLDSCALLADLSTRYSTVWPVYIEQGLRWEKAELVGLARFVKSIRRPNVRPVTRLSLPMGDVYGAHWSTGKKAVPGARSRDSAVYLPGRNMVLSVKAAVFAAARRVPLIAIGSLDHNPFPDASPRFFKSWGNALSMGLSMPITIIAPYRNTDKSKVIERMSKWPLHLSFSCINPKGSKHCGRCNKCVERKRAFNKAVVLDRTLYFH